MEKYFFLSYKNKKLVKINTYIVSISLFHFWFLDNDLEMLQKTFTCGIENIF